MRRAAATVSVRRAVLAALLSTGLVGGTAAATQVLSSSVPEPTLDETPTSVPDSTTTTTTTLVPESDVPEAPDSEDGEETERWYEGCGDFTEGNHGDYVKQSAQSDDRTGQSVSEAAKSPCGKPVSSVHSEPSGDDPEEQPIIEPAPANPGTQGSGHGNGASRGSSGSSPGRGPKH